MKATAKNTGARGLRAILESVLMEAMYEVCLLVSYMVIQSSFPLHGIIFQFAKYP